MYREKALAARRKVLEMIHKAGTSHIASNFSVIDIATVLYENLKEKDQVCWSKGWAAASIYYFGVQRGDIDKEALERFPNAPYLGLAETTVPGVLCNGGAVGHGASVAVGIALGKKRAGVGGTVYAILSDGELNEGTTWEAAMVAGHHRLHNLVFICDANRVQAMGNTKDILDIDSEYLRTVPDKFSTFGWDAYRVNGHSHEEIEHAIKLPPVPQPAHFWMRPKFIMCDTVKGKGVSFMEGLLLYHYKNVDAETYEKAMAELV